MADEVITKTKDQLLKELGAAWEAKDMKLMGKLSVAVAKAEEAEAKVAKEVLQKVLGELTLKVKAIIDKATIKIIESGQLDGADGIWYANDFGEALTTCRLTKATAKKASGGGSGKSSYVSNPAKSADLLAQVGDQIMFEVNTEVSIDKVSQTMAAGTTLRQAYDYSTNGGWRNRVRMALLKAAGLT
jgi:hypothetical protein